MSMVGSKITAMGAIAPIDSEVPVVQVEEILNRRRSVCEALEGLADDLCRPRSRQTAFQVLEFMDHNHFGVPDDCSGALVRALHGRPISFPVLDEISAGLDRDSVEMLRMERSTSEGLDALVRGRIPDNPLDFIMAALSLVEIERRYLGLVAEQLRLGAMAAPKPDLATEVAGVEGP